MERPPVPAAAGEAQHVHRCTVHSTSSLLFWGKYINISDPLRRRAFDPLDIVSETAVISIAVEGFICFYFQATRHSWITGLIYSVSSVFPLNFFSDVSQS